VKTHLWANGPEREPSVDAPVINPFVGEAVAARYAQARPSLHHHVMRLLADRLPRPRRALDVGCGTGLSTRPLSSFADIVVGIDESEAMLRDRTTGDGEHYVRAVAERLPFRDAAFELATIASAIHWLDSSAIEEVGRVLTPKACVAVSDVWFRAEMLGVDTFADWMAQECAPRYRRVPKREYTEGSMSVVGFLPAWEENLRFPVAMKLDQLVSYLMTHSERIAAVREGTETEAQQDAFLTEGLKPFFEEADVRQLGFGIQIEVFSR
jgi:ubiquinone/menaquinone biosynthesis C-methylase UbiE